MTDIDLTPFDKCEPIAKRADWLAIMTGWPVQIHRGRNGYLLIAPQFVVTAKQRIYLYEKITNAELEK
jgi:hypothetical protein